MGFSMIAEAALHAALPHATWASLISKLGYSFGFLIVILGSQQLFTENTLTPIVPLLSRKSRTRLKHVSRLWAIVLTGNLIGAFFFALLVANAHIFKPEMVAAFGEISRAVVLRDPLDIGLSAIFAGWIIALMVWMLPASESGHTLVIILMTWLIGVGGFAHVVAGSIEAFYLAVTGAVSIGNALLRFTLPALIGNVIGGVALVAALNHAQVVAGRAQS